VITVGAYEAKTHLPKLLDRVVEGEQITITRNGKPVARLVPVTSETRERSPGSYAGQITLSRDFDAPLPDDVLAGFDGGR
jgi:prevent-host-death family protein